MTETQKRPNRGMQSKARKIWSHISKRKNPFTAKEVAEDTGMDIALIRHYLTYWHDKESVAAVSKQMHGVGELGRPKVLWECVHKDFISVWR